MPPVVLFHQQTGQPSSCLRGLGRYAQRIAQSPLTGRFTSAAEVRDWLWAQPLKLDTGDGEHESGCTPEQRSRVWPKDGLNCWEATAHWLGWHLRNESPIEAHLFDTYINGQRHVFPAARYLDETTEPVPIVLQPPAGCVSKRSVHAVARNAAQALEDCTAASESRTLAELGEPGWAQGVLFPPPMQLLRRKEVYFWDSIDDLIREGRRRASVGEGVDDPIGPAAPAADMVAAASQARPDGKRRCDFRGHSRHRLWNRDGLHFSTARRSMGRRRQPLCGQRVCRKCRSSAGSPAGERLVQRFARRRALGGRQGAACVRRRGAIRHAGHDRRRRAA